MIAFISDLHLYEIKNSNYKLFKQFIQKDAVKFKTIYILGDLFYIWFGDDLIYHDNEIKQVADDLKFLTSKGIKLYFIRGNRDIVVGKKFCKYSNIKLLPDEYLELIDNNKCLMVHGDTYCRGDYFHLIYRFIVGSRVFIFLGYLLPVNLRQKIAYFIKNKSKRSKTKLDTDKLKRFSKNLFLDKNYSEKRINKYQANVFIHGHTHNPYIAIKSGYTEICLGEWTKTATYAIYKNNKFYLQNISLTNFKNNK